MGKHTKQIYTNNELAITVNSTDYTVDVIAHADYYYDAGRMYMNNGDPGYPPESELTIKDIDAVWFDADGNEVEATEEMTDALESVLQDEDGWEEEEPPEPDYEYDYEARAMARWEAACDRAGV